MHSLGSLPPGTTTGINFVAVEVLKDRAISMTNLSCRRLSKHVNFVPNPRLDDVLFLCWMGGACAEENLWVGVGLSVLMTNRALGTQKDEGAREGALKPDQA